MIVLSKLHTCLAVENGVPRDVSRRTPYERRVNTVPGLLSCLPQLRVRRAGVGAVEAAVCGLLASRLLHPASLCVVSVEDALVRPVAATIRVNALPPTVVVDVLEHPAMVYLSAARLYGVAV